MNKIINVIYSSDDNYAQHMGISIYSLLENNKDDFEEVNIYIIENNISIQNKEKLESIENEFNNLKIYWIQFEKYLEKLNLNMSWPISISAYARLFVSSMLPETVNKILYLDCDMIINGSLSELWNYPLNDKIMGVVQDPVNNQTKAAVGLSHNEKYFNSGMLLIDIYAWRNANIEAKIEAFINEKNGNVIHHDQGVLNGVLKNDVVFVPLKYNVMTIQYFMKRDKWLKYFKNEAEYYSEEEYIEAKENPVIIHYTPSFTSRPWVSNCKHPLKCYYYNYLNKTQWSDFIPEKDNSKWYIKLINWRYRNLPL